MDLWEITCLGGLALLSSCANMPSVLTGPESAPVVDASRTSRALESLPPKPLAQRVPVTIYEFRSAVPAVNGNAATDMFITALIKSGQFRVVERQRLSQGVVYEKQLNGAGQTTGRIAAAPLRGARYIFEGALSEANATEAQRQGGINIAGLSLGGSSTRGKLAIDVRIVDAATGDVVDSVDVRKPVQASNSSVGGTAGFIGTLAAMGGHAASPLTPDLSYQSMHDDGLDQALRACIESAVLELSRRVALAPDAEGTPAPTDR